MDDPVLGRGILRLRRRIGGDVLRNIFSSDDFFRKQIKAKRGRGKHEAQDSSKRTRSRSRKNSLPNRTLP
jgi:hypothetical protein